MDHALLNALKNLLIKKSTLNIPCAPKGNKIKILTYVTLLSMVTIHHLSD